MKKHRSLNLVLAALVALWSIYFTAPPAQAFDRKAYERTIEQVLEKMDRGVQQGPYQADWESLAKHDEAPEWFRDAKLGIYWHWGVYSVPAYGNEWYPKWMHTKEGRRSYYKHHVETYGEPDEFGYHDFVPEFGAEHFDAEQWAELFKKAGAQYAGPVCEHHDGYSMWDSEITPWNAADTGPKRDITGELAKAIRKHGMKFVTTFHHERTRSWYPRVEGWPTTSDDPKLQLLYMNIPEELFNKIFQAKLGEVIDKYRPDLIWFDGRLEEIQEPYHLRFLAYYFNQAKKWNRDVVVTTKGHDYPAEVAVEDFEKGRMNRLTDFCWLTDDTISMGSWCYTIDLQIKSTTKVIHDFIDIVSKNGCLLLNISPKSDGTIPENQRQVLLGLGEWLKINGEAIYNTRPWLTFGEGPTRLRKGGGFVGHVTYTAQDIRYTRSKDGKALYAIALGWPESGELTLNAVKVENTAAPKVTLLGYHRPLRYQVNTAKQLVVDPPELDENQRPCKHAYVFKITGFKTSLHPMAEVSSDALSLDAGKALLAGPQLQLEEKIAGRQNIGHWNDPQGQAHWLVHIQRKGSYLVSAVVAAISPSKLAVEINGQTIETEVPATGGFDLARTIEIDKVQFDKSGVYHLALRPAGSSKWKPINLWRLQLTPSL